jgi:hypothetical protein
MDILTRHHLLAGPSHVTFSDGVKDVSTAFWVLTVKELNIPIVYCFGRSLNKLVRGEAAHKSLVLGGKNWVWWTLKVSTGICDSIDLLCCTAAVVSYAGRYNFQ